MNYMSEVAKMLGVELGEEFEIIFPNSSCRATALLNSERLYIKNHNLVNQDMWQLSALTNILNGTYTIKRKPWRPKVGEIFWHINYCGETQCWRWENGVGDYLNYYKLGNCYSTAEEAKANHDKWVEFYKSDEVLEV